MSARERNKLKRSSRALQRSGSQEGSNKRSKSGNEAIDSAAEQAAAEADDQDWQDICGGLWPFQAVCDQMCIDILDPAWEVITACMHSWRLLSSAVQNAPNRSWGVAGISRLIAGAVVLRKRRLTLDDRAKAACAA